MTGGVFPVSWAEAPERTSPIPRTIVQRVRTTHRQQVMCPPLSRLSEDARYAATNWGSHQYKCRARNDWAIMITCRTCSPNHYSIEVCFSAHEATEGSPWPVNRREGRDKMSSPFL